MKNVKFRGKKTNSAENSAAQIPRQKPKFRGPRKTVGPTDKPHPKYVQAGIYVLYCIQIFIWRPSTAIGKQRCFWFDQLQEKREVLRSDKDVERLDDRREARAEGGRRFQKEGA